MALTPAKKKEIISKYGASASDTGSPEAQVALLSTRIDQVTEHLKTNKNDHHNRRGLDRKSTRLNSSHIPLSRMPSSA